MVEGNFDIDFSKVKPEDLDIEFWGLTSEKIVEFPPNKLARFLNVPVNWAKRLYRVHRQKIKNSK